MRKCFIAFCAILFALGFVACQKPEDVSQQAAVRTKAPINSAEYNADFDSVAFAVHRLFMENAEFKDIVRREMLEQFDGDFNLLINQLVEKYRQTADYFRIYDVDIYDIVRKYPYIQISISDFARWNGGELPVVFFPYMYDETSANPLPGYDTRGVRRDFNKEEIYETPFVIIKEKITVIYVSDVNVHIAESFAVGFYTSLKNSPKEVRVISVDSILDFDGKKTEIYVFNFEKEGYVLTSASIKNEPIIGYSQKGYFAPINEETTPEGLIFMLDETMLFNLWLRDYGEKEREVQRIIQNNAGSWYNDLNYFRMVNNFRLNPVDVIFIDPCDKEPKTLVGETYENTVGYFCQTTWDQGQPYNYFKQCCPTGCQSVAMAQIFRFHKHPSGFNWSIMPNIATTNIYADMTAGDYEVARLMRHLGNNMNTTYKEGGSSATTFMAWWVLKYKYNYSSSYIKKYDYDKLKNEIKNDKRPIFIRGDGTKNGCSYSDGHAYVADGYQELVRTYKYTCLGKEKTYQIRNELIHYNFGWAPYWNFWYSTNIRDDIGYEDWDNIQLRVFPNFKYRKECIYNIKPK